MNHNQLYVPRGNGSPVSGAPRNDSQDYLLMDSEACEENCLTPYSYYPISTDFCLTVMKECRETIFLDQYNAPCITTYMFLKTCQKLQVVQE